MASSNCETQKKALLAVQNIHKSFSKNHVLKGVNLSLDRGTVLALIGGNGAGKSTLMKIIMGLYHPDSGQVLLDGEAMKLRDTSVALNHGIYMVPQEPLLFPNMTVEENICIGFNEPQQELRERLKSIMNRFNWQLDLSRKASQLSIAEQQVLEILRGILRQAKVLILDEPSSALTFDEVQSLFTCVKELQSQGIGIIYITHRLSEVFTIANQVAILNDGEITVSGPVETFTREILLEGLLPADHEAANHEVKERKSFTFDPDKEPLFELKNYSGYGFKNINMKIYPGEIVGLAGVVGAGRTELACAIFGRQPVLDGQAILDGVDITGWKTTAVMDAGLAYVPEDRHLHGLFKILDVPENTCSATLGQKGSKKLLIDRRAETELSLSFIEKLSIKVASLRQKVGSLSGGNQQKLVIARSLSIEPKLIILDEPTRGIDAAARGDVYQIIHSLKEEGVAILLISSDLEEIVELSDRALSLYRGRINAEFRGDEVEAEALMKAAFGIVKEVAHA